MNTPKEKVRATLFRQISGVWGGRLEATATTSANCDYESLCSDAKVNGDVKLPLRSRVIIPSLRIGIKTNFGRIGCGNA